MTEIAAVLLVTGWAYAVGWRAVLDRRANILIGDKNITARTKLLCDPWLLLLDRMKLWERIEQPFLILHQKLGLLYGREHHAEETKRYIAETCGIGYAALTIGCVLSWLAQESGLLAVGLLLAIAIPAARFRDLGVKVTRRRQDILQALPEVLSKLMLLTSAGEPLSKAILRCTSAAGSNNRLAAGKTVEHPLYAELQRLGVELGNGTAFPHALEAFSKRCAVQEAAVFTTTLLLNYRRGGERFTQSLRELSNQLWEKRKAVARARGEEASAKLVFPLAVIFLVLMVLVASPAMLMFA